METGQPQRSIQGGEPAERSENTKRDPSPLTVPPFVFLLSPLFFTNVLLHVYFLFFFYFKAFNVALVLKKKQKNTPPTPSHMKGTLLALGYTP